MIVSENLFSKLFCKYAYLKRDVRNTLGFYNHFYKTAKGARILIYHGICQNDHTRFNPIFLKLKTFESHLEFYKRYFNVISLDDYYGQHYSNKRFNICITFDDGFANNYKYVLPLLKKYELPATFFITAIRGAGYDILWNDFWGIVSRYGPASLIYKNEKFAKNNLKKYISTESGKSLVEILRDGGFDVKNEMMQLLYPLVPFRNKTSEEDYWLQMSKEQIKELASSPMVSIGSHSYYHNDLARIGIDEAREEMVQSKLYLENVIVKEVKALAFPYGTYTREVVDEAKKSGYSQLLAMDFHFPDNYSDPVMRERFTVNPFISTGNQMYATITGRYEQ